MVPRDEAFFFESPIGRATARLRDINELPNGRQFIRSGGRRLYGLWQGASSAPRAAVLYCHPYGEEKKSAHRAFVETARALAAQGVASLRFDMTGCGDSDGEFHEATFEQWVEDVGSAWAELRRRAPEAAGVAVGLRLGAAVAVAALQKLAGIQRLILWQPVVQGKPEFDTDLRRLLVQQMMVRGEERTDKRRDANGANLTNDAKKEQRKDMAGAIERGEVALDGYIVSTAMYRAICGIDLMKSRERFAARCAIVQFGRPVGRIQALADAEPKIPNTVLDTPPIWSRTDFIPDPQTGELLAREGVLRWVTV